MGFFDRVKEFAIRKPTVPAVDSASPFSATATVGTETMAEAQPTASVGPDVGGAPDAIASVTPGIEPAKVADPAKDTAVGLAANANAFPGTGMPKWKESASTTPPIPGTTPPSPDGGIPINPDAVPIAATEQPMSTPTNIPSPDQFMVPPAASASSTVEVAAPAVASSDGKSNIAA